MKFIVNPVLKLVINLRFLISMDENGISNLSRKQLIPVINISDLNISNKLLLVTIHEELLKCLKIKRLINIFGFALVHGHSYC